MAKRKSRKKTKARSSGVQHQLPAGFWAQVGAVLLIALALLMIVSWFGNGGPVLRVLYELNLQVFGYGVYVCHLF